MSTPKAGSFSSHYFTLKSSVDALRQMDVADLDEMLTQVDRASKAYKGCQERISAVKRLLEQRLGEDEAPAAP
jgi:exodeoxyribonuclease VII small subunit